MTTKTKLKKCRVCKRHFKPFSTTQIVCSTQCAIEWNKRQLAKRAESDARIRRKQTREMREALKTRSEWVSDTQKAFNAYIRERDFALPCISCDTTPSNRRDLTLLTGSRWDAGHYRSIGSAPELRFCEENCFKQCVKCNQHLSGNTVEYRKRLTERIGIERVEWVESKHEAAKYTIDELKAMIKMYRQKTRELKKRRVNLAA